MARKTKEEKLINDKKKLYIKIAIFALICLLVGISFIFATDIENFINFKYAGEQASTDIDESGLVVHFIDVDQADAIAVSFPNGETMLIDTGDNKQGSNQKLMGYLENKFFANKSDKVIDHMLITHSDADHVGGADEVLEAYQVNNVYHPDIEELKTVTKTFDDFYQAMLAEPNCENEINKAGNKLDIGSVTIELYSPFYNSITSANNNNQSPIMIMTYADKRIMFTGDARNDLEKEVLEKYPDANFNVDVLKVAHHGASSSSCKEFLNQAKPEYAIISVGKDNSYGHPTEETISRLKQNGVKDNCLYRTDLNGNVILSISNDGNIAIATDNSTYTTVFIKWVYVAPGIVVICAIVLFVPKSKQKDLKKAAKKAKNN